MPVFPLVLLSVVKSTVGAPNKPPTLTLFNGIVEFWWHMQVSIPTHCIMYLDTPGDTHVKQLQIFLIICFQNCQKQVDQES